jgi:hypothetical protein
MTTILIVLALLIIVGGGLIYYATIFRPNQLHDQATATVVAKITGTAQANATSTGQVVATSQAQANATATAQGQLNQQATATVTAIQTDYNVTSGTPAFSDSLNSPSSNNWDNGSECNYANGAYHVKQTQKNTVLYCVANATNFNNFVYQIQMTIVSGEYGGIVFRADSANSKFYLFRINQAGAYDLYVYIDTSGQHAKTLTTGTALNMNQGANQSNTLTAIAHGNSIALYVNKQYLTSVNDSTLTAGQIGVVSDDITIPTEVVYSQAQVWKL